MLRAGMELLDKNKLLNVILQRCFEEISTKVWRHVSTTSSCLYLKRDDWSGRIIYKSGQKNEELHPIQNQDADQLPALQIQVENSDPINTSEAPLDQPRGELHAPCNAGSALVASMTSKLAINNDELNLGTLVHLFFACTRYLREVVRRSTQSLCPIVQLEKLGDRRVCEQAMLIMYAYLHKRKMQSWPLLCNSITAWLHGRSLSIMKLHYEDATCHPHIRSNVRLGAKRDYIVPTAVFEIGHFHFKFG
uniref:AlNc14C51G3980 protein n=1 Tax=Albugo laibachii Nc14 TaxID=890382 RepID=F0WBD3_9STRA|nr:AlNc14C51G3980 [Albugo laibachii Nc14]|eukprot:CCA18457.1 AlNc14C51G3980 [Albugo laibachii Nc14]